MSMPDLRLITCRNCGAVMVKISRDLCQKCYQEDEDLFIKIKDYLRSNPGASIAEVAAGVEATIDKVENFVNSGRLERVGVHVPHQCQTCGAIIQTGIICPDCTQGIQTQVDSLKKNIAQKKEEKKGDDGKPRKDGGFQLKTPR